MRLVLASLTSGMVLAMIAICATVPPKSAPSYAAFSLLLGGAILPSLGLIAIAQTKD